MPAAKPNCANCGHSWNKHSAGARGGCNAKVRYGKTIRGRVKAAAIGDCRCPVYRAPDPEPDYGVVCDPVDNLGARLEGKM